MLHRIVIIRFDGVYNYNSPAKSRLAKPPHYQICIYMACMYYIYIYIKVFCMLLHVCTNIMNLMFCLRAKSGEYVFRARGSLYDFSLCVFSRINFMYAEKDLFKLETTDPFDFVCC